MKIKTSGVVMDILVTRKEYDIINTHLNAERILDSVKCDVGVQLNFMTDRYFLESGGCEICIIIYTTDVNYAYEIASEYAKKLREAIKNQNKA